MSEQHNARVRAQLKLALLGDCGCHQTLANLEREARLSGLTGAEIDFALAGRSFEARTAARLTYACAVKAAKPALIEQARARALRFGVTDGELGIVAAEARQILASKTP